MNTDNNNKTYENRQVAIVKTQKALIEIQDNLKYATDGVKTLADDAKLKIVMCDYSSDNHYSVTHNVHPATIAELKEVAANCLHDGSKLVKSLNQCKIFGDPDEKGKSIVTKLTIKRSPEYNGQPSQNPWYISIENGKGEKGTAKTGGTYLKSNTYKMEKSVHLNLTDSDFFKLMTEAYWFVENSSTKRQFPTMANDSSEPAEKVLREEKYVEGVNYLFKSLVEKMEFENSKLLEEIESLKKEISVMRDELLFR